MEPAGFGEPPPPNNSLRSAIGADGAKLRKILVADDERHVVRLIQVHLEREGYEVLVAFDGKEAVERVFSELPDLVILDVMMPFVDGIEVLKRMRKDRRTESTPIILLTVKAQDSDVYEGYQHGADMYLTKPFNPMDLISFLRRSSR